MGSTHVYYKKALQTFAYGLNYMTDKKKAESMGDEPSIDVLEKEINKWKQELSKENFYYEAGRASEVVLNIADENDGCDGFNACIGGLYEFETFLGLHDTE